MSLSALWSTSAIFGARVERSFIAATKQWEDGSVTTAAEESVVSRFVTVSASAFATFGVGSGQRLRLSKAWQIEAAARRLRTSKDGSLSSSSSVPHQ
jgi:hypothetical protein